MTKFKKKGEAGPPKGRGGGGGGGGGAGRGGGAPRGDGERPQHRRKGAKPEQKGPRRFTDLPSEKDADMRDVSDEDREFFKENPEYMNFMSGINAKNISQVTVKPVKPVKRPASEAVGSDEEEEERPRKRARHNRSSDDEAEEEPEADFERMPRRAGAAWQAEKRVVQRLPTKQAGQVVPSTMAPMAARRGEGEHDEEGDEDDGDAEMGDAEGESEGEGGDSGEELDSQQDGEGSLAEEAEEAEEERPAARGSKKALPASKAPLTPAQLLVQRKQRLVAMKEEMADTSSRLVATPEQCVNQFPKLLEMCEDVDLTVRRYALLSVATVFADILPGYRIRQQSEKELAGHISKEVQELWDYERTLLDHYKAYLDLLERTGKEVDKAPQVAKEGEYSAAHLRGLLVTSVKCLCKLLLARPQFNFSNNLVVSVVKRTASTDEEIYTACVQCLRSLFEQDADGEATLETVKAIAHLIKTRSYNVPVHVLEPLFALRLALPVALPGDDADKGGKKKHKKSDIEKEVSREFAEADAVQSTRIKNHQQTELVKFVFLTYFRILKKAHSSPLMPAVLDGVAKFSHLISVDFLPDMLDALRELAADPAITLHVCLKCIVAAAATLRGPGAVLTVDLKEFYALLYALLPRLLEEPDCMAHGLTAVHALLIDRRQVTVERVAAFIKRIATLAMHMAPNASIAFLSIVQTLLLRYPRTQQLLDIEKTAMEAYRPDVDDPDHTNAFGSTLWELAAAERHFHPFVGTFVRQVGDVEHASVKEAPNHNKLFRLYDASAGGFNPAIQPPRVHPLVTKAKAELADPNRKKKRALYIRPPYETSPFLEGLMRLPAEEVSDVSGVFESEVA